MLIRLPPCINTLCIHIFPTYSKVALPRSGFLLNKTPGQHQPKRVENARILIANTPMDTDKIKVFGSRVKVERVSQVAEIELAEKEKMKDKVSYNLDTKVFSEFVY